MFTVVESSGPKIYEKNEYTHQILGCDDIEPPNAENNDYMHIISPFSYFMHMINFIFCYIIY